MSNNALRSIGQWQVLPGKFETFHSRRAETMMFNYIAKQIRLEIRQELKRRKALGKFYSSLISGKGCSRSTCCTRL